MLLNMEILYFYLSHNLVLEIVQPAFCICGFYMHGFSQSKIKKFEKILQIVPQVETWICHMPATIYISFTHFIYNYLHSIYIVLGIINNPEMIIQKKVYRKKRKDSIWEDVCRLFENTMLLYIRNLSIHGLWYSWGPRTNPLWIPEVTIGLVSG